MTEVGVSSTVVISIIIKVDSLNHILSNVGMISYMKKINNIILKWLINIIKEALTTYFLYMLIHIERISCAPPYGITLVLLELSLSDNREINLKNIKEITSTVKDNEDERLVTQYSLSSTS